MKFLTDTLKKSHLFLDNLAGAFERPQSPFPIETFRSVRRLLLAALLLLALAGSLIFWVPRVISIFVSQANNNLESNSGGNLAQLELAQNILKNTKRMVGDQQAWAESIRLEYNQLFGTQQNSTFYNPANQHIDHNNSYSDNFVEAHP